MSPLLQEIASALPRVREPIKALLNTINVRKASMEEKSELWRDETKYPAIRDAKAVGALNCGDNPVLELPNIGDSPSRTSTGR
jgi:hypothetical protein